jgi:undecaprenyl-diphosphatase
MLKLRTIWRDLLSTERPLLLSLLLVAAALFGFLKLASEVGEGDTMAFDRWIIQSLRSPLDPAIPLGPTWLAEAMTDITAFGSLTALLIVTLTVVAYLLLARHRRTAAFVFAATSGGTIAGNLLKLVYNRPRPTLVPHLVDVTSASFPSGHATDSAVVYLTLAALLARTMTDRPLRLYVLAVAIVLTLMIGFSRVYLGVHWPSDVVAGWTFGAAWALCCSILYRRLYPVPARANGSKR